MRDCTEMFNESGEHIATMGFNESYGLWQIVIVQRKEMEFFCPTKEVAFAACTTNSIPKLNSRNRPHALASMPELRVSSPDALLCNF